MKPTTLKHRIDKADTMIDMRIAIQKYLSSVGKIATALLAFDLDSKPQQAE
jgi:hypothetical protein